MLHTKTKPGTYSDKDYWTVSWTNPENGETIVKEYGDVDDAYEDFCYYRKHAFPDIKYEHHVRE